MFDTRGGIAFDVSMAHNLKSGFYDGVVKSLNAPGNTVLVTIKDRGDSLPCLWTASIISGMIGFKTTFRPPLKTEVVVWVPEKGGYGYIIGTKPGFVIDPGMQRRDVLGNGDQDDYTGCQIFHKSNSSGNQAFLSHKPPVDMAEGEINIENWMGVGLTMLRNLSTLQAGDLARVECHVMDDMVRIISDTFRHYTAFGDYEVYNDGGKLNVVWNGTSFDHEAWGNLQADQPLADQASKTEVGNAQLHQDLDDGRWRFTQYMGWLGNFIHTYVTDPVNMLGRIAENQFRSGKAHLHVNDDGSVILQTVADIVLEKVVRIPVPIPIRKADDPAGNQSDQPLNKETVLKTWKPSSTADLFEMAFQLRDYARWLNNTYALARFHQMPLDYQVPSEAQTPEPKLNSAETDKTSVNKGTGNWQLRYSTIRIYRDGSIQTVDAYGNAITTTKVGVYISTPRDLLLQAGGSVNIVAGKDVNILAQQNVNLTAITQSIRLKAQTVLQGLCAAGNVLWEVASGYYHQFIGALTYNGNVMIDTQGNVNVQNTINVTTLNSNQVFQVAPYTESGFLDTDTNLTWPLANLQITEQSIPSGFTYQTDYGDPVLYQTVSQQLVETGDVEGGSNVWSFSVNTDPVRGTPWPGQAQEKYTTSGQNLNSPSSDTIFTNQPKGMQSRTPQLKTL
jgi:hypothetical protein